MKKIIIGLVIAGAIVTMILINVLGNKEESPAGASGLLSGRTESVEAEVIQKDTITSSILITGAVEEIDREELRTSTALKIEEVLVDKGDRVKKGDQLFTVDIEDLQKQLTQQEINYDIQTLSLERLVNLSTYSDETSMVVALSQSKLSKESAQRYYDKQVADLEKNASLFETGIISAAEFEAYQSGVLEAESQLASAKLSYQRSSADLTSVRKNNDNLGLSSEIDVKIQVMTLDGLQMTIDSLKEEIEEIETMTKAPIDGVVTSIDIESGDYASSMAPLLVITDVEHLKITANIREYDIKNVALNQEVLITGDAIGKEDQVRGLVTYIASVASESVVNNRQVTGIEVEMSVETGAEFLKPGYTTDCEIITSQLEDVVVVSYEMLSTNDEDEDVVFVIDGDQVARMRVVELGTTSDFSAQVISGLEAGEMVVMNPSLSLFDGTKVTVITEEEGE